MHETAAPVEVKTSEMLEGRPFPSYDKLLEN